MKQRLMNIAMQGFEVKGPLRMLEAVVVSDSPVSIRLKSNAKLEIPNEIIIVSEHLTNHTRQMRVNGGTVQTYEFMDGLKTGEKVMVAAIQGGQSFFILDRI